MSEDDAPPSDNAGDGALPDFEHSMAELEALVDRMEAGDQSLEAALADFERGVRLTRHCQKALTEAQQKVDQLLENRVDSDTAPFNPDDE